MVVASDLARYAFFSRVGFTLLGAKLDIMTEPVSQSRLGQEQFPRFVRADGEGAPDADLPSLLLVDETRLGERLGVMMVALAYQGRSIPLAWWCYEANHAAAYPEVGQVGMIQQLLLWVRAGLPEAAQVTVQADRGIGCSPTLAQFVAQQGWYFLFRVTGQTKIVTETGDYTIYAMVQPGEQWQASGKVFKRRGRIPARACALWEVEATEPWALVTNHPNYDGRFGFADRCALVHEMSPLCNLTPQPPLHYVERGSRAKRGGGEVNPRRQLPQSRSGNRERQVRRPLQSSRCWEVCL